MVVVDRLLKCIYWDVDFLDPYHVVRVADAIGCIPLLRFGSIRQRREFHRLLMDGNPPLLHPKKGGKSWAIFALVLKLGGDVYFNLTRKQGNSLVYCP
jgi:hypothetical protein